MGGRTRGLVGRSRGRTPTEGWRLPLITFAMLATSLLGVSAAGAQTGRPLPIDELDVTCNPDMCILVWTPTNDPSTLRSWDVHVNGRYRTWIPIADGARLEYGPEGRVVALRDVAEGDTIRIVPVGTDGVWASAGTATHTVSRANGIDLPGGSEEPPSGAERPRPIEGLELQGCSLDACFLGWTATNDPSTLRSWDVHVNGAYRTWIPIADGARLEYGPGASDPRLRDVQPGDTIRVIPVGIDGTWAESAGTPIFGVTVFPTG